MWKIESPLVITKQSRWLKFLLCFWLIWEVKMKTESFELLLQSRHEYFMSSWLSNKKECASDSGQWENSWTSKILNWRPPSKQVSLSTYTLLWVVLYGNMVFMIPKTQRRKGIEWCVSWPYRFSFIAMSSKWWIKAEEFNSIFQKILTFAK